MEPKRTTWLSCGAASTGTGIGAMVNELVFVVVRLPVSVAVTLMECRPNGRSNRTPKGCGSNGAPPSTDAPHPATPGFSVAPSAAVHEKTAMTARGWKSG